MLTPSSLSFENESFYVSNEQGKYFKAMQYTDVLEEESQI